MTAQRRRQAVDVLREDGVSERRGCALIGMARSHYQYEAEDARDEELVKKIKTMATTHKRYGYRRVWALLRREGERVNIKRVHRLWRKEGLTLPQRRPRKRLRRGGSVPLSARYPNHVWTYDFMQDQTADGRTLRILTIVDEFTRESKAIAVERRMPAAKVIDVLGVAFTEGGMPEYLRSDNGPEFIAEAVQTWLASRGTRPHYIEPASPWQNAYGESFNDKVRGECLNMEVFDTLAQAKVVVSTWRHQYNEARPHSSLGYLTPIEYRQGWAKELSLSPAPRSLRSLSGAGGRKGKLLVNAIAILQSTQD